MKQDNSKEGSGTKDGNNATDPVGQDFSMLVSIERSHRWDTAKNFWSEKKEELGCSYNRYVVIEKGTSRASLELAIRIIRALGIPDDSGLCAWVRDLMPDEQCRSYFPDPYGTDNNSRLPLLSLNNSGISLFRDEEFAFEVASYVSIYSYRGVSEDELCEIFCMMKSEIRKILIELLRVGLVLKNSKNLYEVSDDSWIEIPGNPEFRDLKARFFEQAIESHFTSPFIEEKTFEIWCRRLLSQRQINILRAKCQALTKWIGMQPDEPEGEPYYLCLAGKTPTFGNARKKIFNENREILNNEVR